MTIREVDDFQTLRRGIFRQRQRIFQISSIIYKTLWHNLEHKNLLFVICYPVWSVQTVFKCLTSKFDVGTRIMSSHWYVKKTRSTIRGFVYLYTTMRVLNMNEKGLTIVIITNQCELFKIDPVLFYAVVICRLTTYIVLLRSTQ